MAKDLNEDDFKKAFSTIVEKVCLCVGLGNGAIINKDIPRKKGTQGVAICPGPNTAYFKKVVSLKEMVDHIYGRINLVALKHRPHMFVKELQLYVNYLNKKLQDYISEGSDKQQKYLDKFILNLQDGIDFYEVFFDDLSLQFGELADKARQEIKRLKQEITQLQEYLQNASHLVPG